MADDVQVSRFKSTSRLSDISISRRAASLGLLAYFAGSQTSIGNTGSAGALISAGCAFFFEASEPTVFIPKNGLLFPDLRRIGEANASNGLAGVLLELGRVFDVNIGVGLYNDENSGIQGNAGAIQRWPFQSIGGIPDPDGLVALGDRCLSVIETGEYPSAARAAICAHELGHILQAKYVGPDLAQLRKADRSVVRTELHADFVCGYYASVRKRIQPDYPAVISAVTQFKFGDNDLANPLHHGTPRERGDAVQAGFVFGLAAFHAPVAIAKAGLDYVKSI